MDIIQESYYVWEDFPRSIISFPGRIPHTRFPRCGKTKAFHDISNGVVFCSRSPLNLAETDGMSDSVEDEELCIYTPRRLGGEVLYISCLVRCLAGTRQEMW